MPNIVYSNCSKCGKEIEKSIVISNPVCYECKTLRRNAASKKNYVKKVRSKKYNKHEHISL